MPFSRMRMRVPIGKPAIEKYRQDLTEVSQSGLPTMVYFIQPTPTVSGSCCSTDARLPLSKSLLNLTSAYSNLNLKVRRLAAAAMLKLDYNYITPFLNNRQAANINASERDSARSTGPCPAGFDFALSVGVMVVLTAESACGRT